MHVTAPVLVGDTLHGALVCGPTVLGEVDHQVIEAIESLAVGSLMSTDAIVAWLDSLPRLAPWEASSFSDVVFRIALSCCDREGAEYLSAVPEHKTSSDIGPYLDYLTSMEGEKHSSMRYPIEKESRLMAHVAAGDRTGAEKTLREILEAVSTNRVTDAEEARSRVLELVVLLSRAAIAGGAEVEQVFGLEYRSLTRLRTLSSVDEIARWLSRILKRFVDLVFDLRHLRYAAHLSSALRLMHNSFRERVTLSDAAAAAGLSSGYLARIFRRELRCSFTTYLNRIRIQEAKRLLRTTSMQIGEIGAASGITDHSYFTQAFRRETGLTPRHYRNRIRDHRQQRR
jgi:two-component system response regulator YesN